MWRLFSKQRRIAACRDIGDCYARKSQSSIYELQVAQPRRVRWSHYLRRVALLAAGWLSAVGMALLVSDLAHVTSPVAGARLCHSAALGGVDMPLGNATAPVGDACCGLHKNGTILVVCLA